MNSLEWYSGTSLSPDTREHLKTALINDSEICGFKDLILMKYTPLLLSECILSDATAWLSTSVKYKCEVHNLKHILDVVLG